MSGVFRRRALLAASALFLSLSPIHAVQAEPASAVFSETAQLRPGEYIWQPELAPSGEVVIVVSVPLQTAYVYRGETLIGVSTVSTGRRGHATPTGRFNILQKRREHYSNLYNNAPMPFMQRLTWDGIALHAGHIPGRPASHGCIRLPMDFARQLFAATELGGSVHVIDLAPPSPELALAMARPVDAYVGMGGPFVGMGGPEEEEPVGGNYGPDPRVSGCAPAGRSPAAPRGRRSTGRRDRCRHCRRSAR